MTEFEFDNRPRPRSSRARRRASQMIEHLVVVLGLIAWALLLGLLG
jgi:hypothetical protein